MASVKLFDPGLHPFECSLCSRKMTSQTSFDNHLAGKFHRAKESANNRLVDANRHTHKTLTTDTNIVTTTSQSGKMPNSRQQGPITLPTVSVGTTADVFSPSYSFSHPNCKMPNSRQQDSSLLTKMPNCRQQGPIFSNNPLLPTVLNSNSISKSSTLTFIDPRNSVLAIDVSSFTLTPTAESASANSYVVTSLPDPPCKDDVFNPALDTCTVSNPNSISKSRAFTAIDPRDSSLAIAVASFTLTPASESASAHLGNSSPAVISLPAPPGMYDDQFPDPMKMIMKEWSDDSRQQRRHAQQSRLSPRFSGCFNQSALYGDCIGTPLYIPISPFLCRFCDIVFESAHALETHLGSIEHVHQFRDIHDRFFIASYTKLLFSRINSDDIHDKMCQLAKKTIDFDVFIPDPELLNEIHFEPPMHPIPGILDFGSDEEDSYSHHASDHDDCEFDVYEDEYGLPYGY